MKTTDEQRDGLRQRVKDAVHFNDWEVNRLLLLDLLDDADRLANLEKVGSTKTIFQAFEQERERRKKVESAARQVANLLGVAATHCEDEAAAQEFSGFAGMLKNGLEE